MSGPRVERPPSPAEIESCLVEHLPLHAGVPVGEIDPEATFADPGMSSRDAIVLIGDLIASVGAEISPAVVRDHPGPRRLRRHPAGPAVEDEGRTGRSPVVEPIAVLGLGYRFPGASDAEAYRRPIRATGSGVAVRRPAPVPRVADGRPFGCLAGDHGRLIATGGDTVDPYSGTGRALTIMANRLSHLLGLHGPSLAVVSACSSSLVAVVACRARWGGDAGPAIAAGVHLVLDPEIADALNSAAMLAGDGWCHTFDATADGRLRAEGCGAVVLKRFTDAPSDGDTVPAVISGAAVGQDGRSNGLTAPDGPDRTAVILRALSTGGATVRFGDCVTRLRSEPASRIPVPTYPFQRKRHWWRSNDRLPVTAAQAPAPEALAEKPAADAGPGTDALGRIPPAHQAVMAEAERGSHARIRHVRNVPATVADPRCPLVGLAGRAPQPEPASQCRDQVVQAAAAEHRVTPFVLLMSACTSALRHWSRQPEPVIGVPITLRDWAQSHLVVGNCVRLVAVVSRREPPDSLSGHARRQRHRRDSAAALRQGGRPRTHPLVRSRPGGVCRVRPGPPRPRTNGGCTDAFFSG